MIRRISEAAADDFAAFRAVAVSFVEHLRERNRSAATLRQRWRTLAALLAVIAKRNRTPPYDLGALPEPEPCTSIDHEAAMAIVRDLMAGTSALRFRDAAIVGLLADAGLAESTILALRVRDVPSIACAPEIADALAECTRGALPQEHAIRGPQGRALSRKALYYVVRNAGTTVAALGRASRSGTLRRSTTRW